MGDGTVPYRDVGIPVRFRALVVALGACVAAIVPPAVPVIPSMLGEIVLWMAFLAAANLLSIPILPRVNMVVTLGAPVTIAAAVVLGPAMAAVVTLLGSVSDRDFHRSVSPWLKVFNRLQFALTAAVTAYATTAIMRVGLPPTYGRILGGVGGAIVYMTVNTALVTVALWGLGRLTMGQAATRSAAPYPRFTVDWLLVGLLAVLIIVAYGEVGVLAVVLLSLPLGLGYRAMLSTRESQDRAERLAAQVRELEVVNGLGGELLLVSDLSRLRVTTEAALRRALETTDVVVALDGVVDDGRDLQLVKVRGAEPAAVAVPPDLEEGSLAVVESVAGLLGVAIQRVQLMEELAEVQRARVALSGRILEEGTRERSRIALEIHDDVLPYLAAAEIQADNIRTFLQRGQPVRAEDLAGATRDAVGGGIVRLREVLDALRRQIIVPGGLRPGLDEALADLRMREGVVGRLDAPDPLPPLPLAVEILVLETVRGCLVNVARHAVAHTVTVKVDVTESIIKATVCDDGRGFSPVAVPEGHHGLSLMGQRVELARGHFDVTSAPGRGTRISLEVPL